MKSIKNYDDLKRKSFFLRKFVVFCMLSVALFLFCSTTGSRNASTKVINPYWNELAQFLGGMPIAPDSRFKEISESRAYKRHVSFMDRFWESVKSESIDKILPWQKTNISNGGKSDTVFYPLSGADFIYMHSLFPNDSYYLMVAMEDPGNIEGLRNITPAKCKSGLPYVRRVIYPYGAYAYFQSRIMKKEMRNVHLTGIAPVLLTFLARMGLQIVDVEKIGLDNSGTLTQLDAGAPDQSKKIYNKGIRIYFTTPGDSTVKKIVYVSMKLTGESTSAGTPSGRFLNSFSNLKTMMKAAVYLCHYEKYFPVKDFILKKSAMIVQDDSGVPFRFFDQSNWSIRLFGVYRLVPKLTGTIVRYQADLAESFKNKRADLPFLYSYGGLRGKKKSNLMIAEKKL